MQAANSEALNSPALNSRNAYSPNGLQAERGFGGVCDVARAHG